MQIRNLPYRGYLYAALGINAVCAATIVLVSPNLPPVVPLFYGKPIGPGQLVPVLALTIAPAVSFGICLINIFLSSTPIDILLKKILSVASFFIAILSLITVTRIILLVGFW